MNWYLTKIVFRIICGTGNHIAQFDEQLRLVSAKSKEDAFYKAQQLGKQDEEIFLNHKQKPVQWKFINVCEIYKLGELMDGAELYSRLNETENAGIYIEMVNKKADGIIHSDSHEMLQLV
jgi:Domain of unknown function (DUF4288)